MAFISESHIQDNILQSALSTQMTPSIVKPTKFNWFQRLKHAFNFLSSNSKVSNDNNEQRTYDQLQISLQKLHEQTQSNVRIRAEMKLIYDEIIDNRRFECNATREKSSLHSKIILLTERMEKADVTTNTAIHRIAKATAKQTYLEKHRNSGTTIDYTHQINDSEDKIKNAIKKIRAKYDVDTRAIATVSKVPDNQMPDTSSIPPVPSAPLIITSRPTRKPFGNKLSSLKQPKQSIGSERTNNQCGETFTDYSRVEKAVNTIAANFPLSAAKIPVAPPAPTLITPTQSRKPFGKKLSTLTRTQPSIGSKCTNNQCAESFTTPLRVEKPETSAVDIFQPSSSSYSLAPPATLMIAPTSTRKLFGTKLSSLKREQTSIKSEYTNNELDHESDRKLLLHELTQRLLQRRRSFIQVNENEQESDDDCNV